MGNDAFAQIANTLSNSDLCSCCNHSVPQSKYESWRYGFLFDALKNQRYGQSFCNAFDITDNVLFYERDIEWADRYIKTHYVNYDSSKNPTC